jgi:CBS domain-containing protein
MARIVHRVASFNTETQTMPPEQPRTSSAELIDALLTAKEAAKIQLNLLAIEARRRWHEVEDTLDGVERPVDDGAPTHLKVAFDDATATAKELTQVVKDMLRDIADKATDLGVPVRRLLKGPPRTCAPTDSLAHAAKLLWDHDCGMLIVTDTEGRPLGVLTDRDICMAAYTRGLPLERIIVADSMSRTVHCVDVDAPVTELAAVLAEHQIRRVPVLEHGKVVGLASLADIALLTQAAPALLPISILLAQTLVRIVQPHTQR